jgi:hypothetical protein
MPEGAQENPLLSTPQHLLKEQWSVLIIGEQDQMRDNKTSSSSPLCSKAWAIMLARLRSGCEQRR